MKQNFQEPTFQAWLQARDRQQARERVIDAVAMVVAGAALVAFFAWAIYLEHSL